MAVERVTERTDGVTAERTIERDPGTTTVVERSGGGFGTGLIALVLIALVAIVAIFLFTRESSSEAAKNNAIAGAAADVGDAAQNVGEAVGNAADRVAPGE